MEHCDAVALMWIPFGETYLTIILPFVEASENHQEIHFRHYSDHLSRKN